MIRHFLFSLVFLSLYTAAQNNSSDKTTLSEGSSFLFKNVKSKLTNSEKNLMFKKTGLELSKDKKQFMSGEYPVDVQVFPTDLNKDGREEIFVGLASTSLFGNTGESFLLFIKNKAGIYEQHEALGNGRPVILSTKNLGYPDLLIGGPGFEFPVLRWNGKKYIYSKMMKDAVLQKTKSTDIDEFSKSYTSKIQP
jgi:hypothetical protein